MAFISVHAPLRVTSDSITAQQQSVAKMHRVEEIVGFEPGFPHPKLHVKTMCNRFLVGHVDDERQKISCQGCSIPLPLAGNLTIVVLPAWLSLFRIPTLGDLVLRDWKTGRTGEENR